MAVLTAAIISAITPQVIVLSEIWRGFAFYLDDLADYGRYFYHPFSQGLSGLDNLELGKYLPIQFILNSVSDKPIMAL